jgi:hypothetical protein
MDDLVAHFCAFTDAAPGKAAAYLRLTDNNVEQAVQLYFEDPNLAVDAPSAPQAVPQPASRPPRSRTYAEDESGVVHIPDDSDEELDMDEDDEMGESSEPRPQAPPAFTPNVEDDEALARRLQEEMYSSAGRAQEDVRAPMGRTTEVLVGPGATPWADEADEIEMQMAARQARRSQANRKNPLL